MQPVTTTINYYSKDVFGQRLYYLADPAKAIHWQNISGKKTITQSEMAICTKLTGATFERVFEPEA